MKPEVLRDAYKQFFLKSEPGKYFMAELDRMLESHHSKAEEVSEHARDEAQAARGNREVLKHIQSVTTEVKRKR